MHDWKTVPRNGQTRQENLLTQPLRNFRAFNNPKLVTEGWYPLCSVKEVRRLTAKSFTILNQRVVVYRGESGKLNAMDAFCPHMGADLSNGKVIGEEIECYFHQWRFCGSGKLTKIQCQEKLPNGVQLRSYPVEEKYGTIWIFAGDKAPYPVPNPPGLDGKETVGIRIARRTLFVHHHIIMVGGIDMQHFGTVHQLDINFNFDISEKHEGVFDWKVGGEFPKLGWRAKLGRLLLGNSLDYQARFAGGSVVTLSYGTNSEKKQSGFKFPQVHIFWGNVPLLNGVSQSDIHIVMEKRAGIWGRIVNAALFAFTIALLFLLRDDDIKAFPYMRFDPKTIIPADQSAFRLISLLDKLKLSPWTPLDDDSKT